MKINQASRIAKVKKFHLQDHFRVRFLTASDLTNHLNVSLSHAYKLISGQATLTDTQRQILRCTVLGAAPGWPEGWYFEDGKLYGPTGRHFTPNDLQHYEFTLQIMRLYELDMKRLVAKVNKLEAQLKEIQDSPFKVYVNDQPRQKYVKHLKIVK